MTTTTTTGRTLLDITIRGEFGLDGGRVDAIRMETPAHLAGETHVAFGALAFDFGVDLDVDRGHDLGVAQLPDMQVVGAIDPRQLLNVFFDMVDAQPAGHGLQQDARGGFAQGDGGRQDDDGDQQRNARVDIVLPRVVGQPDNQRRGNDADVAQGVSHHMEEHATHVEVVPTAPMAMRLILGFRLRMLVVTMQRFVRVSSFFFSVTPMVPPLGVLGSGAILRAQKGGPFGRRQVVGITAIGFGQGFPAVDVGVTAGSNDSLAQAGRVFDLVDIAAGQGVTTAAALRRGPTRRGFRIGFVVVVVVVVVRLGGLVTMTLFDIVARRPVAMAMAMTMRVVVEEDETEEIGQQTQTSHDTDEFGVVDRLRLDETLDGFEENGDTQGDQKDSVDQST